MQPKPIGFYVMLHVVNTNELVSVLSRDVTPLVD